MFTDWRIPPEQLEALLADARERAGGTDADVLLDRWGNPPAPPGVSCP